MGIFQYMAMALRFRWRELRDTRRNYRTHQAGAVDITAIVGLVVLLIIVLLLLGRL
jgi:energy-coupling factor transporter transmembrane protein EcfT